MILSILIPTMYKRAGMLASMLREIYQQIEEGGFSEIVEVLVKADEGEVSTGKKRNDLLHEAKGEWVVFVDDDDEISPLYLSEILKALETNPDAVGINGTITSNGANEKRWFISKDHGYCAAKDEEGREIYMRYNNHLSPTRRSIAIQVGYPDVYIGEDYAYANSLHLLALVKTEVKIDRPLYKYKFLTHK